MAHSLMTHNDTASLASQAGSIPPQRFRQTRGVRGAGGRRDRIHDFDNNA
jgi:hypothetical protein